MALALLAATAALPDITVEPDPGPVVKSLVMNKILSAIPEKACLARAEAYGISAYIGSVDWVTAYTACQTSGLVLAYINTPEENEALKCLLTAPVWIGLNDGASEGTFEWAADDPFEATYTNWFGGYPTSDAEGNNDCVYMSLDGTWSATTCGLPASFACREIDAPSRDDMVKGIVKKAVVAALAVKAISDATQPTGPPPASPSFSHTPSPSSPPLA